MSAPGSSPLVFASNTKMLRESVQATSWSTTPVKKFQSSAAIKNLSAALLLFFMDNKTGSCREGDKEGLFRFIGDSENTVVVTL